MQTKIYCHNCKWFRAGKIEHNGVILINDCLINCIHKSNLKEVNNYYKVTKKLISYPQDINKDNNCINYYKISIWGNIKEALKAYCAYMNRYLKGECWG